MDKLIRVLCVFGCLNRGGAESMCMNLYRNIDREKVQFDFVKHTPQKGAFEDEILSLGGRIYEAPRFKGYNLLSYQTWWRMHLSQHQEHQIIHGHYFTAAKYYFAVCKRMDRITVGHSHTDTYTWKNPGKLLMIHGMENTCDYRFACSENAGKLLYPHKDYTVLKNAIDIEKYTYDRKTAREIRDLFGLGDSFVLGTVGTIKTVKNPLGMVDILNSVVQQRPNTKLLWVGSDGGMKSQTEQELQKLGLFDNVVFTGVRSDVPRLLQTMDGFLLPSFSEGLPVSLIEAQAAGLPCFVSDSVTKEADITGLCHFLPIDEPGTWAEAILSNRTPRENTAQKIIDAGYDIHTTAEWLQNFYLEIIKNAN